jgi:hypothetical protein
MEKPLRWVLPIALIAAWSVFTCFAEQVEVPGVGTVLITAEQPNGELPRLNFTNASSGKLLGSVVVANFDPKDAMTTSVGRLRFRVLRSAGLPDPTIVAVFDYGGGSDCHREPVVVGYLGGGFRNLLPRPVAFWTHEGFALGNFGAGNHPAFAIFNVVPGGETHYQPHQFSVEVFSWDRSLVCFGRLLIYTPSRRATYGARQFRRAYLVTPLSTSRNC